MMAPAEGRETRAEDPPPPRMERWKGLPPEGQWTKVGKGGKKEPVKSIIPVVPANSDRTNQWTPQMHARVAGNIARTWESLPEHQVLQGSQFFPTWHKDAAHLGERLGKIGLVHPDADPVHVGASVLAHLSPKNEAEKNRIQAYQLTHLLEEHGKGPWEEHLGPLADALSERTRHQRALDAGLESGAIKQGDENHLGLQKRIGEHQALVDLHRSKLGMAIDVGDGHHIRTPLADLGTREIHAALNSIGMHHPLESLGRIKRRDFGEDIADPYEERSKVGDVTGNYIRGRVADTHMTDLGLGAQDVPYTVNRGLNALGRYRAFSGGISTAHRIIGEDVPGSEFMAGTWVGQQNMKLIHNPSARKARKASASQIERMLSTPQFAPYMPQHYGMAPVSFKYD